MIVLGKFAVNLTPFFLHFYVCVKLNVCSSIREKNVFHCLIEMDVWCHL